MKYEKFKCQNPECNNKKDFMYAGRDPRDVRIINVVCCECDFEFGIDATEYDMSSVSMTRQPTKPKKEKEKIVPKGKDKIGS